MCAFFFFFWEEKGVTVGSLSFIGVNNHIDKFVQSFAL